MEDRVFISIITIVYNGERTIERTIQSILNQKFTNYEYIIQDGGSNDKTIEIARSYENKFQGKMHIYSEKDKGIYDAMNKGITHAIGKYIWLVNADDWIEPGALKDIYDFTIKSFKDYSIIAGWINVVSAETGDLIRIGKCSELGYVRACKKLSMGVCHPATIVSREVYETVGLYDDRYYISADIDFILRCYKLNIDIAFLPKSLSNMTRGGISSIFPVKKNLHDIWLRVSKFKSNIFARYFYMALFSIKFFIIKIRGSYL